MAEIMVILRELTVAVKNLTKIVTGKKAQGGEDAKRTRMEEKASEITLLRKDGVDGDLTRQLGDEAEAQARGVRKAKGKEKVVAVKEDPTGFMGNIGAYMD